MCPDQQQDKLESPAGTIPDGLKKVPPGRLGIFMAKRKRSPTLPGDGVR